MKRFIFAVAAMLAATLLSGSAFAIPLSPAAKAFHASGSAVVKVHCGCHHRHHGYYHRTCGGCGLYTYSTRCMTCGTCGGGYYGASYYGSQCGCGYYGGGWGLFGWF